jgi:hypothetical protein
LLVAREPGATLRFPLAGSFACFMGFTDTRALVVRVDGAESTLVPVQITGGDGPLNWPLAITNGLSDAPHVIEITAGGPMLALADIFYFEPAPGNA